MYNRTKSDEKKNATRKREIKDYVKSSASDGCKLICSTKTLNVVLKVYNFPETNDYRQP